MRILLAATVIVAMIVPATASASTGLYRTDAQAEHYLEQTRGGSAFCLNGYYSKREHRTGRHFANRGERFRSFTCTWGDDTRSANLYLQTRPHGRWVVLRDR